jgi:hypothetical protein
MMYYHHPNPMNNLYPDAVELIFTGDYAPNSISTGLDIKMLIQYTRTTSLKQENGCSTSQTTPSA